LGLVVDKLGRGKENRKAANAVGHRGIRVAASDQHDAMQRPRDTFHLLDLASQAEAVQTLLVGRPLDGKVAWLEAHGKLSPLPRKFPGARQVYSFESNTGIQCAFFIDNDDLVFVGDNTTWSVPRRTNALHSPPMQRTGAAGIVSFVRRLLGRGSGR
jgi:hypothetical protein